MTSTERIETIGTYCRIRIADAPELDGRTPVVVRWEVLLYDFHEPGECITEAILLDAESNIIRRWRDGFSDSDLAQVPTWVPRPPDGWDLGVRIDVERRVIDAEQAATYTVDPEVSWWPGMDEPGHHVTVTNTDGIRGVRAAGAHPRRRSRSPSEGRLSAGGAGVITLRLDLPTWTNGGGLIVVLLIVIAIGCLLLIACDNADRKQFRRNGRGRR